MSLAKLDHDDYTAILKAGIEPRDHRTENLEDFAIACYRDNSADELLEAINGPDSAIKTDCQNWDMTPEQAKYAMTTALEYAAYDYAVMNNLIERN